MAAAIAECYRGRWDIEGAFQDLTVSLQGEPHTLGYPPAALLAVCLAGVADTILRLTRAALGAAHGPEKVERAVSSYSLAQELAKVSTGMAIALPAKEWQESAIPGGAEKAQKERVGSPEFLRFGRLPLCDHCRV